jgi:hypothetical protein
MEHRQGEKMELKEYFENTVGRGVLATADSEGLVDAAVYSRPLFIDDQTVAFVMMERLSHANIQSNPHATYLFMEEVNKYEGKRLYLTKTKEETDQEVISRMTAGKASGMPEEYSHEMRFLVYFTIDAVLPLIGNKEKNHG